MSGGAPSSALRFSSSHYSVFLLASFFFEGSTNSLADRGYKMSSDPDPNPGIFISVVDPGCLSRIFDLVSRVQQQYKIRVEK